MQRVVITGLGVVSPIGCGRDPFWSALMAGKSGVDVIRRFDVSAFPVRIGAEVKDLEVDKLIEMYPDARGLPDRKVLLGLAAAQEALADAEVTPAQLSKALLLVGVGLEAFQLEALSPWTQAASEEAELTSSWPVYGDGHSLQTPLDRTSTLLGDRYGFGAGKYTNCSACAAGAQVVGQTWEMLADGQVSVALAGATDSMLNPLGLGGFSLLRVLSDENEDPRHACRPFDASRKGTVLGEGAAFLVLETLEHALGRDATIYAEIIGYGSSMDAFRVSDPDDTGQGAVWSMLRALRRAGLRPDEIDCVNAHGTGTVKNDIVETAAVKEVFGAHAHRIPVHSIKSMTGHMVAASGAVEALASVMALWRGRIPPTINLSKADDACDLDYVADGPRVFYGDTILSNSFGFGGQNATLIFKGYNKGGASGAWTNATGTHRGVERST